MIRHSLIHAVKVSLTDYALNDCNVIHHVDLDIRQQDHSILFITIRKEHWTPMKSTTSLSRA